MYISKSYTDVRRFGPNKGIPMLHLQVETNRTSTEDAIRQVLDSSVGLDWVFVKGDNVQGLGSFIKGLAQCKLNIEVELSTLGTAPGWISIPNNVLVHHNPESSFNYFTLKSNSDYILFKAKTDKEIIGLKAIYEDQKLTPCGKWLVVDKKVYWAGYALTVQYGRCRMSLEENNESVEIRDPKDILSVS